MSKKKKQWLTKLAEYCEFESVRGGVNITKIYKPCYSKNTKYQKVKNNFCKVLDKGGLDSCKRIAGELHATVFGGEKVQDSTLYIYTLAARTDLYGKPMSNIPGEKGTCSYVWCKKNPDTGRLYYLSDEEEAIKQRLIKEYFSTADEKTAMVKSMIDAGELASDEAWEYYDKIMNLTGNYIAFLQKFKELTGVQLVRGTVFEENMVSFEE